MTTTFLNASPNGIKIQIHALKKRLDYRIGTIEMWVPEHHYIEGFSLMPGEEKTTRNLVELNQAAPLPDLFELKDPETEQVTNAFDVTVERVYIHDEIRLPMINATGQFVGGTRYDPSERGWGEVNYRQIPFYHLIGGLNTIVVTEGAKEPRCEVLEPLAESTMWRDPRTGNPTTVNPN